MNADERDSVTLEEIRRAVKKNVLNLYTTQLSLKIDFSKRYKPYERDFSSSQPTGR